MIRIRSSFFRRKFVVVQQIKESERGQNLKVSTFEARTHSKLWLEAKNRFCWNSKKSFETNKYNND